MIKSIVAAFQFLTIFPLPIRTEERHLNTSVMWYPLVGAVIGLITGYTYFLIRPPLGQHVAATITILIYILVTRALHLDGFMDTIDGFFSRKDRNTILTIMKESTVGSFAVLGAGVWFLLLFSILPSLTPAHHVLLHTLTRFLVLLPALFSSYPRESGTGKFFVQQVNPAKTGFALILTILIVAAIYLTGKTPNPFLLICAGCIGTGIIAIAIITLLAKNKIGGITGDVLGFSIETNHVILALTIMILTRYL